MNIAMLSIIIHVYLLLWFCYFSGKKLCGGYSIIKNHFLSNGFWFPGSISKLTRPVNSERHPGCCWRLFCDRLMTFLRDNPDVADVCFLTWFWSLLLSQCFCQSKLLSIKASGDHKASVNWTESCHWTIHFTHGTTLQCQNQCHAVWFLIWLSICIPY